MRSFVLLDRDGTVIVDKHYLSDPDKVELLPGAVDGLRRMQELGFGLALLTNQSGVGRGYFSEEDVQRVNARLLAMLEANGVHVEAVYYCPHGPDEQCHCRKPQTGMMVQAATELVFDPFDCFMIGDKLADVQLGHDTGAVAILVRTGKGASEEPLCHGIADYVVDDLCQAAGVIEQIKKNRAFSTASPARPQ